MKETKAALRYARSLITLAEEQHKIDKVNQDMKLLADTIVSQKDLQIMLRSPLINSDKKISILKALFEGKIGELSMKFLELMTHKKREHLLPEIVVEFNTLYRELKGITRAEVTTARPLDDNIRSQIRAKIAAKGEIEFVEKIDPSLIGGFIVRIGDKQFDGSIVRSILDLKKDLLKNEYVPAF